MRYEQQKKCKALPLCHNKSTTTSILYYTTISPPVYRNARYFVLVILHISFLNPRSKVKGASSKIHNHNRELTYVTRTPANTTIAVAVCVASFLSKNVFLSIATTARKLGNAQINECLLDAIIFSIGKGLLSPARLDMTRVNQVD